MVSCQSPWQLDTHRSVSPILLVRLLCLLSGLFKEHQPAERHMYSTTVMATLLLDVHSRSDLCMSSPATSMLTYACDQDYTPLLCPDRRAVLRCRCERVRNCLLSNLRVVRVFRGLFFFISARALSLYDY